MNPAPRALLRRLLGASALALCACQGPQSALDPAGPQAGAIYDLGLLFVSICGAVYVLVLAALIFALLRGRNAEGSKPRPSEHRMRAAVGAAAAVTSVILFGLLVASVWTGRGLASLGGSADLLINITGHQWWWEVEYVDVSPARRVKTANEIHIPVGRPVRLATSSADVIHSFWVPNLHGKRDLIPGERGEIRIQADKPGLYRGQCAEFCGYQHAHMAFVVVAETPVSFAAWLEHQRQSSMPPGDETQQRGQDVFLRSSCVMCHTVRGTPASATIGPDLTHLASRRTIAAGTLPNQREHLERWVGDPQRVKPGNNMPVTKLSAQDLADLVSYLGSLQ